MQREHGGVSDMQNLLFFSQDSNAISGAADVMNYSGPNQIIVSGNLIRGGVKIATRYWSDSLAHLLCVWYFGEINVNFCHAPIAHFCPLSTHTTSRLYTSKHTLRCSKGLKSQRFGHKFCIEAGCKGLLHLSGSVHLRSGRICSYVNAWFSA